MNTIVVIMLIVIGGGHSYNGKPVENKTVVVEEGGIDYCLKAKAAINDLVKKPVADCLTLTVNTETGNAL